MIESLFVRRTLTKFYGTNDCNYIFLFFSFLFSFFVAVSLSSVISSLTCLINFNVEASCQLLLRVIHEERLQWTDKWIENGVHYNISEMILYWNFIMDILPNFDILIFLFLSLLIARNVLHKN